MTSSDDPKKMNLEKLLKSYAEALSHYNDGVKNHFKRVHLKKEEHKSQESIQYGEDAAHPPITPLHKKSSQTIQHPSTGRPTPKSSTDATTSRPRKK